MESLIILAIMFPLMWVLLVLPRRRMQQAHLKMVASIEPGDDVVTSAGIYGTVTAVDDDVIHVLVAPSVEIRVARLAVGRRVSPDAVGPEGADDPAAGRVGPDALDELDAPDPGSDPDEPGRA